MGGGEGGDTREKKATPENVKQKNQPTKDSRPEGRGRSVSAKQNTHR